MKKLNRKGFTLIELLAVIVILAVVMVVTIPSVIKSMNSAREKSLQNAADAAQEWFQKEYDIDKIGSGVGTPDKAYNDFAYTKTTGENPTTTFHLGTTAYAFNQANGGAALEAAGIAKASSEDDIILASSTITVNANGKVCIHLAAKKGGKFWNTDRDASSQVANSSNCSTS